MKSEIFGRINAEGNVAIFWAEDLIQEAAFEAAAGSLSHTPGRA